MDLRSGLQDNSIVLQRVFSCTYSLGSKLTGHKLTAYTLDVLYKMKFSVVKYVGHYD